MTPRQLYESPFLKDTYELWDSTVQGEDLSDSGLYEVDWSLNTRVKFRSHFYKNFDGRRYMGIESVWFDDKPYMITLHGGREGNDHG